MLTSTKWTTSPTDDCFPLKIPSFLSNQTYQKMAKGINLHMTFPFPQKGADLQASNNSNSKPGKHQQTSHLPKKLHHKKWENSQCTKTWSIVSPAFIQRTKRSDMASEDKPLLLRFSAVRWIRKSIDNIC